MRKVAGILFILAGIASAAYFGSRLVANGITMIVDGAKAGPTDGGKILLGILTIMPLAELAAGALFTFFFIFGITLLEVRTDTSSKSLFNWH